MSYGIDKWLMPITLTASNNKFRINETGGGAGELIETIAAGTYYLHDSNNSTYPGLLYEIRTALTSSATGTLTWEVATPSSSYHQTGAGLRLVNDTHTFTIDFGDVDFTMDPRCFGFTSSDSVTSSTDPAGNNYIESKYTCRGQWRSYNEFGGEANEKVARKVRNSRQSHARPADAYQVTWNRDDVRRIVYEHVPAAHVFENRASGDVTQDMYASVGRLASGDNHNAFETIWDNGLRTLAPVLILHGDGHERIDLAGNYDAVRMMEERRTRDFGEMIRIMRAGGEYYRIETGDLYLEASTFDY